MKLPKGIYAAMHEHNCAVARRLFEVICQDFLNRDQRQLMQWADDGGPVVEGEDLSVFYGH